MPQARDVAQCVQTFGDWLTWPVHCPGSGNCLDSSAVHLEILSGGMTLEQGCPRKVSINNYIRSLLYCLANLQLHEFT